MRIASFLDGSRETWGIVMPVPGREGLYVFEPQKVENLIRSFSSRLGPWRCIAPTFMPNGWPEDIKDFLSTGKRGMDLLQRLHAFLETDIAQGDTAMLLTAGHALSDVKLLPPVPRPGLFWGLVSNSPYSWRNTQRPIINFFPQAHQRSIGALVANDGIFCGYSGFNVEMGVVIGEGGRDISIEDAWKHIAGYTVVIDSQVNDFYPLFDDDYATVNIEEKYGWYVGVTASWMGKNADAHCVCGPWLTTPEETGCPYDLLMYTRQNGMQRDRSHSAGTSIGAERAIAFYSSFASLRPGDIIHLGTIGTDGIPVSKEMYWGRGNTIESEIERVGKVTAHLYDPEINDWMSDEEKRPNADFPGEPESIQKNFSQAVRHFLMSGKSSIAGPASWNLSNVSNFYICFANYKRANELEHELLTRVPRVLNAPATALTQANEITLAKRADALNVGVEIAFVVKKLACKVSKEKAADYILGYAPMISMTDESFAKAVIEPASPQERGLPSIYGRWGDGYNVLGSICSAGEPGGRMSLAINGSEMAMGHVDEYAATGAETLSFISQVVTLFPGDVITLGRTAERVHVDLDTAKFTAAAEVDGIGGVSVVVRRRTTGG
jgi:2-keto-4-pentenoate hydratase/2-oxohepta-3-ene-1,7-dioic acid hydratase in catechol pathway